MNDDQASALVARALAGEREALTELVAVLTPVIQARIARTLLANRFRFAGGYQIRLDVEDLAQEVFLHLFARQGRVLRVWRPEKGSSLQNFVGFVAERRTFSFLRSRRRNPAQEEFTEDEVAAAELLDAGPERVAAGREQLCLLLKGLRQELSPRGWRMFEILFVREMSVAEAMAASGLSADAVYAWQSRLRRHARRLRGELSGSGDEERKTKKAAQR